MAIPWSGPIALATRVSTIWVPSLDIRSNGAPEEIRTSDPQIRSLILFNSLTFLYGISGGFLFGVSPVLPQRVQERKASPCREVRFGHKRTLFGTMPSGHRNLHPLAFGLNR